MSFRKSSIAVATYLAFAAPVFATFAMPDQLDVTGGGIGRTAADHARVLAEVGFPVDDKFDGEITFTWTMKWDKLGGTGGSASNSFATFHLYNSGGGEMVGLGNEWYSNKISTFLEPGDGGFSRASATTVQQGVPYSFTLAIDYHAGAPDTAVLNGGGFVNQALKSGNWGFDHIQVRAGNGTNQVDFTNMSMTSTGAGIALDKQMVPEPVFPIQGYVDLYWEAWKQAFAHIKTADGIPQSPYMDEAFSEGNNWIWDTAFMVQFCKYSPLQFPGIQSLNNFYAPMHAAAPSSIAIHIADNPPLFAWTELEYDKLTGDTAHVRDLLENTRYLQKHFEWFNNNARPKLSVYAADIDLGHVTSGGTTLGYHWEGGRSGMDNTNRGTTSQPTAAERPNNPNMLWVDAMGQQAGAALSISRLAESIGDNGLAATWKATYTDLKNTLNSKYWDAADGIYYDIHDTTLAAMKIRTPASFWPMHAEVPSEEQALALVQHARLQSSFGGRTPWVTLARNDRDFDRKNGKYWRGSIWLPTAYMSIKALEKYGYQKLADETASAVVRHMLETYQNFTPATIWECYNPRVPEPAGTTSGGQVRSDFCGWSALGPISLFIENILGFHDIDARTNTVEWRLYQPGIHGIRRLRFGATTTDIVTDGAGNVTVDTNHNFTLVINGVRHAVTAPKTVISGIPMPDAPYETVRLEAESGTFTGGAFVNTDHADFSGTGFVAGFNTPATESISLNINAPRAGTFRAAICFSRGNTISGDGKINIASNGGAASTLDLPQTANWDLWKWTAPADLALVAGPNTIVISNPFGESGVCNVDCVEISYNNRAPNPPSLSLTRIPPGLPAGTAFATLTATDPDTGDELRNLIVVGGDKFRIAGGKVVAIGSLAAGSYPLTIRTADWDGAFSDASFTIVVAKGPDADHDGMDDNWETINKLNASIDESALDPDGDGRTNLEEYVAYTDPNDPTSFARAPIVAIPNSNGWRISCANSSTARNYALQESYDVGISTPWKSVSGQGPIPGNGGDLLFAGGSDARANFFRIKISLP